jgi:AcrR family transcriptional regulator
MARPGAARLRRPKRSRAGAQAVPPKPARRGGPRKGVEPGATRAAVFAAAAEAFSRRGFDGVTMDDIAHTASVNKAMIYYHFDDKLALYREIVRDMLREGGARLRAVADAEATPEEKVARFVEGFVGLTDARPYFPTMMMREIAEGAPHLDPATLGLMREIFLTFARILGEGHKAGAFCQVHPVLAYMSVMAPLMFNAARERAAAQPGRSDLPMFVQVPHNELTRHMQRVALRMLQKD